MTLTQRKKSSDMDAQVLLNNQTSSNSKDKQATTERDTSNWKLLECFSGIFVCYLLFGICIEKITRGTYGENGDKFKYPQVLVFLQCIINGGFAKAMTIYKRGSARDFVKDRTPTWLYVCCGGSYMFAMLSSTNALKYVNYPTQVIGKACKPIAVMILGMVLAGKRYSYQKIICVFIIVVGVIMFMYNPDKAGADGASGFNFGAGEMFLLGSLFLDGFTGVFQEKMRGENYKTTEHNMMYNMNLYGCVILSGMILFTGEIWEFVSFVSQYPLVLSQIGLYGACSAIGQHYIFVTVVTFGPLMCSIITTTRKFFTVLCSVFLFSNPMTPQKWMATVLVFFGLGLDVYGKKKRK
jgi:drug/metabolite transporter (DMT)-like permease